MDTKTDRETSSDSTIVLPYGPEEQKRIDLIVEGQSEEIINDLLSATETTKDDKKPKRKPFSIFDAKLAHSGMNLGMGVFELMRDLSHDMPQALNQKVATPLSSVGVGGFVDQHIGDSFETLAAFTLLDISLEIGSSITQKLLKKGLTFDQKFTISLIGSSLAVSAVELGALDIKGAVRDPLDLFGVAVAAIVLTTSYKFFYKQIYKDIEESKISNTSSS